MKPRLLIISDLFGFNSNTWIDAYVKVFEKTFEIVLYDSQELSEIENTDCSEKELHSQFVNGGLEKAVENLLSLENETAHVLAFSVGGTIAWKAGLKGLRIKKLVAVSSTRLRKETTKPNSSIELLFAEKDVSKPSIRWFQKMELNPVIINNSQHSFYTDTKNIELIKNLLEL